MRFRMTGEYRQPQLGEWHMSIVDCSPVRCSVLEQKERWMLEPIPEEVVVKTNQCSQKENPLEWRLQRIGDLEEKIKQLHKQVSEKDKALRSRNLEIEALEKKLLRAPTDARVENLQLENARLNERINTMGVVSYGKLSAQLDAKMRECERHRTELEDLRKAFNEKIRICCEYENSIRDLQYENKKLREGTVAPINWEAGRWKDKYKSLIDQIAAVLPDSVE